MFLMLCRIFQLDFLASAYASQVGSWANDSRWERGIHEIWSWMSQVPGTSSLDIGGTPSWVVSSKVAVINLFVTFVFQWHASAACNMWGKCSCQWPALLQSSLCSIWLPHSTLGFLSQVAIQVVRNRSKAGWWLKSKGVSVVFWYKGWVNGKVLTLNPYIAFLIINY